MPKGGARPGAGRKPGVKNKRTVEREQKAQEVAAAITVALGTEAFEGDALAYMQFIYKNPTISPDMRLDAAKSAAPFERPKLAAIEQAPPGTFTKHEDALAELDWLDANGKPDDARRDQDPPAAEG
jgi:hypothetical protein